MIKKQIKISNDCQLSIINPELMCLITKLGL